jgi:hypothetical protein
MKKIGKLVLYGSSALAIGVTAISAIRLLDHDLLDRFVVVAIQSDKNGQQHAVSFRYHHADSSSDVFATWILADARSIGSTDPVRGARQPVAVWLRAADKPDLSWGADGRLKIAIPAGALVTHNNASACYFEEQPGNRVCVDSKGADATVQLAPLP